MVPCFGVQIGFTDSVLVCLLDKLHPWVFVGMFDATNQQFSYVSYKYFHPEQSGPNGYEITTVHY